MKIQVFQHVDFEGPAYISEIAQSALHSLHICRFDRGNTPLPAEDYDMLVIMGGPMSVKDDDALPWLKAEKKAVESALKSGKKMIGICLGAQMIADVLGANVYPNREKEIGWFPVHRSSAGSGNPPLHFLPDIATVFHWHGETFGLPDGSVRLYSSEATENQAFLYGDRVLALQFHLEMLKPSIESLSEFCASDLGAGKFIMQPAEMTEGLERYGSSNRKTLKNIFRYYSEQVFRD